MMTSDLKKVALAALARTIFGIHYAVESYAFKGQRHKVRSMISLTECSDQR